MCTSMGSIYIQALVLWGLFSGGGGVALSNVKPLCTVSRTIRLGHCIRGILVGKLRYCMDHFVSNDTVWSCEGFSGWTDKETPVYRISYSMAWTLFTGLSGRYKKALYGSPRLESYCMALRGFSDPISFIVSLQHALRYMSTMILIKFFPLGSSSEKQNLIRP